MKTTYIHYLSVFIQVRSPCPLLRVSQDGNPGVGQAAFLSGTQGPFPNTHGCWRNLVRCCSPGWSAPFLQTLSQKLLSVPRDPSLLHPCEVTCLQGLHKTATSHFKAAYLLPYPVCSGGLSSPTLRLTVSLLLSYSVGLKQVPGSIALKEDRIINRYTWLTKGHFGILPAALDNNMIVFNCPAFYQPRCRIIHFLSLELYLRSFYFTVLPDLEIWSAYVGWFLKYLPLVDFLS